MSDTTFAQRTHGLGWEMIRRNGFNKAATLSPLSATIALAMVAGAASSDTESDFHAKLGVRDRQQLQQSCRILLPVQTSESDSPMVIANALFFEEDMRPTANYARYLEDFAVHTSQVPKLVEAVDDIDDWVARNTHNLIRNLLNRDALKQSGLALINVLAFKGTWQTQFDKQKTVTGHPFKVTPENTSQVDMMFQHKIKLDVGRTDHYTAVRLPYKASVKDTQMSLVAYLPSESTSMQQLVEELAQNDTPAYKAESLDTFGFPKFEVETGIDLKAMLAGLGFPMNASFPGVSGLIGQVIHRAVVKLDEEGTVAAAATAIVMRRSLPKPANVLIFDRPFAFSIVMDKLGIVVFTGIFTKN